MPASRLGHRSNSTSHTREESVDRRRYGVGIHQLFSSSDWSRCSFQEENSVAGNATLQRTAADSRYVRSALPYPKQLTDLSERITKGTQSHDGERNFPTPLIARSTKT